MTNLTVYRYALFLRNLIYQKLRHDENPDDSRFGWDQSDEKTVAELAVYLHLEASLESGPALFYPQLLEAIQNLINNYNQIDVPTLPPPDVMAAYEKHLAEMELAASLGGSPTKQKAEKELRRRTANTLPHVDTNTLEFIVNVIIGDSTITNVEEAVPRAMQIVLDTAAVTQQDVSTEEIAAMISAVAPIWGSNSPNFAAVENEVKEKLKTGQPLEDKTAEAAAVFVADYVSTAIFSPSSTITPSPQFEASAATTTQSPHTAAIATKLLTDNQTQISSLFAHLRQALSESHQIEEGAHKQLNLNSDLRKEDLPQTFAIVQQYVFPVVMAGHTIATQAGVQTEAVKSIDKFLAHIGYQQGLKDLGITNISASARMAAQKAVANLDFSQLFGSTTSTQIFYSSRATSSPQMRYFLQDLATLEKIDFASTATAASKHFDLSGIDASLDKYFNNPDLKNLARAQNFAGDVFAKFVPVAKPIVAIIKPVNKLFFLISEKVFGFTSLGVALNQIRKHRTALFLVGGTGVGIVGLFTGIQVLVFAGGTSALAGFVNRSNFFRGAAKVNAALTSAGAAAMAVFTSFMTVSFIVLLSIPIAVALILFIVNTSAHIVPQASGIISDFPSPPDTAPKNISCPVLNGSFGAMSYDSSGETTRPYGGGSGHGSNHYWVGVAGAAYCRNSLPQTTGCLAPTSGPNNVCAINYPDSVCPYYGYALDVFPSNNYGVYLPSIDGQETTWSFNGVEFKNTSAGYSYGYTDSSGVYSLLFTHLGPGSTAKNVSSGTRVGILFNQGSNTHLHIELQVDGIYVKPENYLCGYQDIMVTNPPQPSNQIINRR